MIISPYFQVILDAFISEVNCFFKKDVTKRPAVPTKKIKNVCVDTPSDTPSSSIQKKVSKEELEKKLFKWLRKQSITIQKRISSAKTKAPFSFQVSFKRV